jgi:hypothetical protein
MACFSLVDWPVKKQVAETATVGPRLWRDEDSLVDRGRRSAIRSARLFARQVSSRRRGDELRRQILAHFYKALVGGKKLGSARR